MKERPKAGIKRRRGGLWQVRKCNRIKSGVKESGRGFERRGGRALSRVLEKRWIKRDGINRRRREKRFEARTNHTTSSTPSRKLEDGGREF